MKCMELTIDKEKRIKNILYNLGLNKWEIIYWQNNSVQINDPRETANVLRSKYTSELQDYYNIANDPSFFAIDTNNNQELDRIVDIEISKLRRLSAKNNTEIDKIYLAKYEEEKRGEIATICETKQRENYLNLVQVLQNADYEDAFKCLMLNDMLTKTYKMPDSKNMEIDPKMKVNKRKIGQSIYGVMNLPKSALDYIYDNVDTYTLFGLLYRDAQIINNKDNIKDYKVTLDGINTFDKGYWIKIPSMLNDPLNFNENLNALQLLSFYTPWCTSIGYFVNNQLQYGDFYAFLDYSNKPHIAITIQFEEINEVRGILCGSGQELEPEYKMVAYEFLEKNKHIENAEKWIERENLIDRLTRYISLMETGKVDKINLEQFWTDYHKGDDMEHSDITSIRCQFQRELNSNAKMKELLLDYLGLVKDDKYAGEEIYFGDNLRDIIDNCTKLQNNSTESTEYQKVVDITKVKVVVGELNLHHIKEIDLPNIELIFGNLICESGENIKLNGLKAVYGKLKGHSVHNLSLNNCKYISGTVNISQSKNIEAVSLEYIGGETALVYGKNSNLCNLVRVDGNLLLWEAQNVNFSNFEDANGAIDIYNVDLSNFPKLRKAKELRVEKGRCMDISNIEVDSIIETIGPACKTGSTYTKDEYIAKCNKQVGVSNT